MVKFLSDIVLQNGATLKNVADPTGPDDLVTRGHVDTVVAAGVGIAAAPGGIYGSGRDGSVTLTSNTTLTGVMEYENLTLAAGVQLNTGGYAVLVRGTLLMYEGASIHRNGNNASGTTQGNALVTTQYGGSAVGGASGTTLGGPGGNITNSLGGNGGAGGSGRAGGTATSFTPVYGPDYSLDIPRLIMGITQANNTINGGAGGASGGSATTTGGGAGGSGGGYVLVRAHKIVLEGAATISANGGNGGNATGAAEAGGGGGGGGGFCLVISTSEQPAGLTVSANGGSGGTRTGTNPAHLNGSAGAAGYARYRIIN